MELGLYKKTGILDNIANYKIINIIQFELE